MPQPAESRRPSPRANQPPGTRRVELQPLEWDTEFFGVPMGTIVLVGSPDQGAPLSDTPRLERDLRRLLAQARSDGYAHLIFRVSADDAAAIWAAQDAGLRLVDIGIDSMFALCERPLPEALPSLTINMARVGDIVALRELAASAFVRSRFSADPFFSREQAAALYREWITNLCTGLADAVLVCRVRDEPVGFISCTVSGSEGRIPLIATHGDYRRKGIGRSLLSAALRWFTETGARVVYVKTQAYNYPALALYHRAGFTVSKTELTFSIALRAPGQLDSGA